MTHEIKSLSRVIRKVQARQVVSVDKKTDSIASYRHHLERWFRSFYGTRHPSGCRITFRSFLALGEGSDRVILLFEGFWFQSCFRLSHTEKMNNISNFLRTYSLLCCTILGSMMNDVYPARGNGFWCGHVRGFLQLLQIIRVVAATRLCLHGQPTNVRMVQM